MTQQFNPAPRLKVAKTPGIYAVLPDAARSTIPPAPDTPGDRSPRLEANSTPFDCAGGDLDPDTGWQVAFQVAGPPAARDLVRRDAVGRYRDTERCVEAWRALVRLAALAAVHGQEGLASRLSNGLFYVELFVTIAVPFPPAPEVWGVVAVVLEGCDGVLWGSRGAVRKISAELRECGDEWTAGLHVWAMGREAV